MATAFRVRIDIAKLTENLQSSEAKPISNEEVREFLTENGFIPQDDGTWLCEDVSLGLLDESEVLSSEPV